MRQKEQSRMIEVLIRARYPILYVVSWEEPRVTEMLIEIGKRGQKKVFEWSCSGGIVPAGTHVQAVKMRDAGTKDPLVALNQVTEELEPAIYIFKDFHPFLAKSNFSVIRKLRDISQNLKSSYKTLVLISPFLQIPPELEKDLTVIDFNLPDIEELGILLDRVCEEVKDNPKIKIDLDASGREQILKAALGLTLAEAENVFAKALVTGGKLDSDDIGEIFAEKRQIIRKTGLLDYCEPELEFDDIGGLASLKQWLVRRKLAFTDNAQAFGLPAPRGVLLLGVQGCGKSLCAKAVSSIWQLPLLRFDVGKMFCSLVGSSEDNIRRAISVAESIAPCILWVDEIDKAFGNLSSGSTDSGTSQRVLGTFLTWLGEKTSPVFVVATANNIKILPPELMRKGRFDEIFFVDLPDIKERHAIFDIHLRQRDRDPEKFNLEKLAASSEGFSGAEIEQAIISALFDAFYAKRELSDDDIMQALVETVPLYRTMEEEIEGLRDWCLTRARSASVHQETIATQARRHLELE
ncbi:MAG: AAA family ATPase [Planctomycetes bacterium]|nr:AAA family ATPase [Planctomycetota bacterium]